MLLGAGGSSCSQVNMENLRLPQIEGNSYLLEALGGILPWFHVISNEHSTPLKVHT